MVGAREKDCESRASRAFHLSLFEHETKGKDNKNNSYPFPESVVRDPKSCDLIPINPIRARPSHPREAQDNSLHSDNNISRLLPVGTYSIR